MTLLLKQIFAFFKLLNSDTGTNQLAAGIACGFVLGMSPTLSLQTLLIFFVLFFFRIQMGAAFLSAFFFKFIAYLLDPVFAAVGESVLMAEGFRPLFTTLYNMPLIPFTRFNNTVVMGSGIAAILLSPFVFLAGKALVLKYRIVFVQRFKGTKVWKAVQATGFYKWYVKYDELFG